MAPSTMRLKVVVLLSLLVTVSDKTMAQTTTASLGGTVKDESGGVLPGVTLTIRSLGTGQTRTTITDTEGQYVVRDLPGGDYEVEATLAGFATAVRSGINLSVGQHARLDVDLKVGELSDKIVVTADASLVETSSSTIRGLVDDQKIRDLPLNGRSFDQLALLQPGVVAFSFSATNATAGVGAGQAFSVGGARPASNSYLLDGTNLNGPQGGPGSVAGVNLGVEAVQEFEILTSVYDATFGRNSGGVVNIVSKSGTNAVRGSAYEFHRNSAFDARNFFDRGTEPPPFKRNQYGVALGGPIKRDSAFFFGNYEGLRQRLGLSAVAVVPSAAGRQGVLPSGNVVVNPAVIPYLNLFPLLNGRDFGDGTGQYFSNPTQPINENYATTRYDQRVSNASSLFVRYTIDSSNKLLPDSLGIFPGENRSRNQYLTAEHKHVFSSRLLNTARFGYNRTYSLTALQPEAADNVSPSLSFVPGEGFGALSFAAQALTAGAGSLTNLRTPPSFFFVWESFQYMDEISYVKGRHSLRAGANIENVHLNQNSRTSNGGNYTFDSLRNFLLGQATQFQAYLPSSNTAFNLRATQVGVYIQDDFRWHRNVTFNLGLRYEAMTTPREINGFQSQLVNVSDPQVTVGAPLFNQPPGSLQPRVGLAWDVRGDGKTSLRAGFGRFTDTLIGPYLSSSSILIYPFSVLGAISQPPVATFPTGVFPLIAQAGLPLLNRATPNPQFPTRDQFNLSVQRELLPQTVLTVAYTGAVGRHQIRVAEADTPIPAIVDGEQFWAAGLPRRNPNFSGIVTALTDGTSSYNSLQVSVNRRFHDGLQFQGSYTWGKSIDESSSQTGAEARNVVVNSLDYYNPRVDRGPSAHDVRQYTTINATYDLPIGAGKRFLRDVSGWPNQLFGGWQVNAIWTAASGTPVSILTGFSRSRNLDRVQPDRPDLVPGRSNNPVLGGPDRYFDPTAFVLPPAGFHGDLGRNTLVGPGLMSLDVALVKDLTVGPVHIEPRAEMFNVLNRANFGFPANSIFNPDGTFRGNVGVISNTVTTSRQVQFGLKVTF